LRLDKNTSPGFFVSEALCPSPSEGGQVVASQLADHLSRAHEVIAIGPSGESGGSFEPILKGRLLGLRALARIYRAHPSQITYMPRQGLTSATLARTILLALTARFAPIDIVVLLQHRQVPRWLRFARSWRFVASTLGQAESLTTAGVPSSLLAPRVPAEKTCDSTRDEARAALNLGPGHVFLHVGHPTLGRNLHALAPLAQVGTLILVLSDYASEEAGSLPEGPSVRLVRGRVDNLAAHYRAADVYVFPTTDETSVIGTPMSVFESIANGTPVVARRSAALARWDGLPGLILVDDDAALIDVAAAVAGHASLSERVVFPSPDRCAGDLSLCRDADVAQERNPCC